MFDNDASLLDELSLEAALLPYDFYRRRYTLFKDSQLKSPSMSDISTIQPPKYGTYHFIDMSGIYTGPQYSDSLLSAAPGVKSIVHITKLDAITGTPLKVPGVNIVSMLTDYRRQNMMIRPTTSPIRLESDERGLLIYNYSPLAIEWRYAANFKSEYTKWVNVYNTLYTNLSMVVRESTRTQLLDLTLPDRIPSLAKLREFSRTQSADSLKYLREPGDLLIADLFVWVGEHREKSLLSKIPPEHYHKVNFIVRKGVSWTVINLQWLDTFLANGKGYDHKMLEVAFLLLLNRLADIATVMGQGRVAPEVVENDPSVIDGGVITETVAGLAQDLPSGFVEDDAITEAIVSDTRTLTELEKELEAVDIERESQRLDFVDEDINGDVKQYAVDGTLHGDVGDKPGIVKKAEELLATGAITVAQYKRLIRINDKFDALPDPYTGEGSILEAMEITEDDYLIKPKKISSDSKIVDETMRYSRVDDFKTRYLEKVYRKDIMQAIAAIRKFPVAISDYKVVDTETAINSTEEHVIRLIPAVGEAVTIRIPVFKIKKDGTFRYSGTEYSMRNQRADCPIRKISPTNVVLSSYASKCFVSRSSLAKFSYGDWLGKYLLAAATNSENTLFSSSVIATVSVYNVRLPYLYTVIANNLASFTIDNVEYVFDYKKRFEQFGLKEQPDWAKPLERNGSVIVGKSGDGVLVMHEDGEIVINESGVEKPFTDIETLLGVSGLKRPLPMAELKVVGKSIPMGLALGYLMGLSSMLKMLNAKVRRTLPGERMNLEPYEYAIRFKNETLILDRRDRRTTLMMSGFIHVGDALRQYDYALFDSPDVYSPLFDRINIPSRYLRELDTMNVGFVDPITEELLKAMREPHEFTPLLIRATELILDEYVPSTIDDPTGLIELPERVRGYERVAGLVYETLYKAMRSYTVRATRSDTKIVVNPTDVTMGIATDPTVSPVNNINGIHILREREVITFGGKGGRSKLAMVQDTRKYTEEDKGFISEATVDSGDVGVIAYLAPNANITTVRGTVRLYDQKRDGTSMLLSTSSQFAPAADCDVPKRMAYISIQLGHLISTNSMGLQSYRTGAERGLIARMPPLYGAVAQKKGVVSEIKSDRLVVKYDDNTEETYPLGAIEVNAEGTAYPHTLKTQLKEGMKIKPDDVIYYNSGFYIPNELDKLRVDMSFGTTAFVCFREANYTIEDSCAISEHFSGRMGTKVTKHVTVMVDFDQGISNSVKIGDSVKLDTPLLHIEDAFTADMDRDELAQALRYNSRQSPPAEYEGVISDIVVYYNGETEQMSESLHQLTQQSEKRRKANATRFSESFFPNKVDRRTRVNGYQAEVGQAMIVYHIVVDPGMGVSDKLVFGNQLKSTVGKVLFGENTTLSGEPIDAVFGALSGINRTTTSIYKQGGVNTYLRYAGEIAYDMFNT